MEDHSESKGRLTRVIRWSARAWTVASIGLILGFIAGEGVNPSTPAESIGLLFFPAGICAGMILAWWREGLGGSITVGGLLVFYLIHRATAGSFPKGWAWVLFAAPGFLFLLCSCWSRKGSRVAVQEPPTTA